MKELKRTSVLKRLRELTLTQADYSKGDSNTMWFTLTYFNSSNEMIELTTQINAENSSAKWLVHLIDNKELSADMLVIATLPAINMYVSTWVTDGRDDFDPLETYRVR